MYFLGSEGVLEFFEVLSLSLTGILLFCVLGTKKQELSEYIYAVLRYSFLKQLK